MELIGAIVSGFKSLDHTELPLGGLTILFGPNGAGKTNIIEALGAHDPLARSALRRAGGQENHDRARVGLVTRVSVGADGTGPDAEELLEMLAAPWAAGLEPLDITEGMGAYCGSCWWLEGGDLYEAADRANLPAAYSVVRNSLLAGAPASLARAAAKLVDLLLDEPVVIVQEDFSVELTFDRSTPKGTEIVRLGEELEAHVDGVLSHLLGPMRSWTGRFPPLTTMTRGPGAQPADDDDEITPAGFGWLVERLGGIRVVSGDFSGIEAVLDDALESVHDSLWHRIPEEYGEDGDEFCERCLHPSHGGRVSPEADAFLARLVRSDWLETDDGWSRVRPSLVAALGVLEEETNRQLPAFVAEQGIVRMRISSPEEWTKAGARCELLFDVSPGDALPEVADWDGPVGVLGSSRHVDSSQRTIPVADLGAGLRRWVATAVRLAADACTSGQLGVILVGDVDPETDEDRAMEVQSVLRSGLVRPQILLIDEPEQHLHPHAQHVIARWTAEQARNHSAVVVATHSSAFFVLPPEQANICEVRREGHATRVRPLRHVHGADVVERARLLGFELGLGHDALAQLTRAVGVVEGDWDRRLLHHYFGRDLAEQRILIVVLQGSDELGGLADAAVIPALGVPVIALLDEVRASCAGDLAALADPLSKAERGLRDLAGQLGDGLRVVRYEDPDVICALPEPAVRVAYPHADFPGWTSLLDEWEAEQAGDPARVPFKRWALKRMGLPKRDRMPTRFFKTVLQHDVGLVPTQRFSAAAKQLLSECGAADPRTD